MVNPIQNNGNNSSQSGQSNNPDESLKNALYIKEPTQQPESTSGAQISMHPVEETELHSNQHMQMSMNTTETLPSVTHEIETEDIPILENMLNKGPAYEYIDNLGNHGKLDKLSFDANGHLVSGANNTEHAATKTPLAVYVIEGDSPPPPPAVTPSASSKGYGDPTFIGFNGGQFWFQGIPNHIFNLLSDSKIQVNSLFNDGGHGGTTIGQIGILIGNDRLLANPGELPNLNGNILGAGQTVRLKDGTVSVSDNGSTTNISTKEYSIDIYTAGGFINIRTTSEGINRDEVMPDGVIGQTASGNLDLSIDSFLVHDGIFGTNVASNKFEAKTKTDKLKDQTKEKYNLT